MAVVAVVAAEREPEVLMYVHAAVPGARVSPPLCKSVLGDVDMPGSTQII